MTTPRLDPAAVVRDFFDNFGPTIEQMVRTVERLCHQDVWWSSAGYWEPRFTGLAAFVSELERPKTSRRSVGMVVETISLAVDGSKVLTERIDHLVDPDGKPISDIPVMGVTGVEDGKIRWGRDYFFDTRAFFDAWGA
jgi:limonene-1,2-epoxide hydrolase